MTKTGPGVMSPEMRRARDMEPRGLLQIPLERRIPLPMKDYQRLMEDALLFPLLEGSPRPMPRTKLENDKLDRLIEQLARELQGG